MTPPHYTHPGCARKHRTLSGLARCRNGPHVQSYLHAVYLHPSGLRRGLTSSERDQAIALTPTPKPRGAPVTTGRGRGTGTSVQVRLNQDEARRLDAMARVVKVTPAEYLRQLLARS